MQDEQEIQTLRRCVKAADEEFHIALAFHEAWKPTAYDKALQDRIGQSYAANTFRVIAAALRREMLLALVRLWDKNRQALRMDRVGEILGKPCVIDALVAEVAQDWDRPTRLFTDEDSTEEDRRQMLDAIRNHEADAARQAAATKRVEIGEVVSLIRKYVDGEGHDTLKKLKRLRHERLAHREIETRPAATPTLGSATIEEVENFYQDMAKLIRLLKGAVGRTGYDPDDTSQIHAKNARLFWASVRGEGTEGHPSYPPPPVFC